MSEFTVQPESFAPVAQQLHQAADQIAAAWAPVRAQTAAVPFGRGDDDLLSPLIQVSLADAIALLDDCMDSCSDALHGFGDGLEQMGQTYQETETVNSGLVNRLGVD